MFFHKKVLQISNNFFPCFQNFVINWENLIKIRRAGGNTKSGDSRSNWEGWNVCYISRFIILRFCSIQFAVTLARLKNLLLYNKLWQCPNMVIACSIFVMHNQRISCDIGHLCVAEKNGSFPSFFSPINVENCALSSMCWIIKQLSSSILLNIA